MIVTFCGHSKFLSNKEYEKRIIDFLEETVGDISADMYLGGYGEFDEFAYRCCKKYKDTHPNISLIFITPYITVEYQKNHLDAYKKKYDAIIYPEIEDKPLKYAISYRNKWMVEKADYIVCGILYEFGGAYKTYQHAKRKNKKIINIVNRLSD